MVWHLICFVFGREEYQKRKSSMDGDKKRMKFESHKVGGKFKRTSIGRMLIALYILAVLAISATTRAESSEVFSFDQVSKISN